MNGADHKDFYSYEDIAYRMSYSSIKPVQELISQKVLHPVYPIPNGKPRIHRREWERYVEKLDPLFDNSDVTRQCAQPQGESTCRTIKKDTRQSGLINLSCYL